VPVLVRNGQLGVEIIIERRYDRGHGVSCYKAVMLSLLLLAILLTSSHASLSPRSTTDNCAFLSNFDLTAALNANLGITIPDIFGDINTCICSSGVPSQATSIPLIDLSLTSSC